MTTKYTPGPWRAELEGYDSDYGFVVEHAGIRAESGLYVAEVEPHDQAHADIAANASLIAAAPELLAALQMYEQYRNKSRGDWSDVDAAARSAIAKAVQS